MTVEVEIRGSGSSWSVYHDGRPLGAPQNAYDKACISARVWQRRLATAARPCLCCGTTFDSLGKGHRLCGSCNDFATGAMV